MRLLLAAAVCAAMAAAGCGAVPAQDDPTSAEPTRAGTGEITTRLGYYFNDDGSGDGNPFLDEELEVLEAVAMLDYHLTDQWSVNVKYAYDLVTSASIKRLSKFPEQTGASGDDYSGVDVGAQYQANDVWGFGGHAGFSQEYDYDSFGAGLNASQSLEDGNSIFNYSLNGYWDRLDVIRYDGHNEGKETRRSLTAQGSWYQILGRATHGSIGLVATWQQGFLEAPYNAVVVEDPADAPNPNLFNLARGTETFEELPGNRYRGALFGRVRHWLPSKTALEFGSRLYADSWGLQSATLEPLVRQWVVPETLSAGLRYRLYAQTGVDYFQNHFTRPRRYQTQDADLGPFHAHGLGVLATWHLSQAITINVDGDWTARSDGIDYATAGLTINWKFDGGSHAAIAADVPAGGGARMRRGGGTRRGLGGRRRAGGGAGAPDAHRHRR